jgi:hypothetical protein
LRDNSDRSQRDVKRRLAVGSIKRFVTRAMLLVAITGALLIVLAGPAVAGAR